MLFVIATLYKGVKIAEGDAKVLKKELEEIIKKGGKDVGKYLDDVIELKSVKLKLKGKSFLLERFFYKKIIYLKRERSLYIKFYKDFHKSVRRKFIKEMINNENTINRLISKGITEIDIKKIKNGEPPIGWQVHHKIPLDDGGTNEFNNLVLIKNDPYHKSLTVFQISKIKDLKIGDAIELHWPLLDDIIYP